MFEVAPSAWKPPGVSVKLLEKNGGTSGSFVVGLAGTKRIRWSSRFCDGFIAFVSSSRRVLGVKWLRFEFLSREADGHPDSPSLLHVESLRLAERGKELLRRGS